MTRPALTAALAVAALALAPSAHSDQQRGDSSDTFAGSCRFSGELRQKPPLTNTPQPGEAFAGARGECSGTLEDEDGRVQQLEGAHARYFASARGTLSCAGGSATGSGFVVIRGERIDFRFSEIRGPGAGAIRLEGTGGGSAVGEARVSQHEDPISIAEKCGGEGLRRVGIDIDIETTPAISG